MDKKLNVEVSQETFPLEAGDPVEIVGFGSIIWIPVNRWTDYFKNNLVKTKKPDNLLYEDKTVYGYDSCPQMVGQTGFVGKREQVQGKEQYSLRGVEGKLAWYCREQLKKI